MNIEILKQRNGTYLVSLLSGDLASGTGLFTNKRKAEKEARRLAKVYRCEIKRKG